MYGTGKSKTAGEDWADSPPPAHAAVTRRDRDRLEIRRAHVEIKATHCECLSPRATETVRAGLARRNERRCETMNIQFATTDIGTAWEFIRRAMPEVSRDDAQPLLELVGVKVRIGDPFMYGGRAPVFLMPGILSSDVDIISAAAKLTGDK